MSSIKSSYISVSQAIDDAVARYIKKESIESCLVWINEGKDRLTGWAYETGILFGIDDYIFLTTEKELFITRDNLLEYFDADQLNLSADDDILDFIYSRSEDIFVEDALVAHYVRQGELYLTAISEHCGQAGFEFSKFNIFSSKEEYFEHLVNQGYIFWDGTTPSHSSEELISMFRINVTNKYFGSNAVEPSV